MKEDNTVFVLQKALNIHKARVTRGSVKEFLLTHPHYPSLKSVCDGLKRWNIVHYPLKLTKEEILEIEPPYIAHMGGERGQLALVEKIKDGKVIYKVDQGKSFTQNKKEFSERLSGGVIVIEPNQKAGEGNYRQKWQKELVKAALIPVIVISVVLLLIYTFYSGPGLSIILSNNSFLLLITKALGITASVFLVLHEFEIHTKLSDKICGLSSKVDCDSVLSSDVSRIFGNINLADIGIIYFTASLIYLSVITDINQLWVLAAISAISIIFPISSIYYQGFRLKKWCPFCLVIQAALIAEFIILIPWLGSISNSFADVLRIVVLFSMVTAVWILYKSYYELSQDYMSEHGSLLRFKSNPGIFKFLLKQSGYTTIPVTSGRLEFGKPDAPITITAFLSLSCKPCTKAFNDLKALLVNSDHTKVNIIISINKDENSQKLAGNIYQLYNTTGQKKALDMISSWYNGSSTSKKEILNSTTELLPTIKKIITNNNVLFKSLQIPGTPTFYVNGYRFPKEFEVNDIENFTNEIISLTMESKGQEACSHCK